MKRFKLIWIIIAVVLSGTLRLNAQDDTQTEKIGFVIVASVTNYDDALKEAKQASKKLNYKLDLRGLSPNSEIGLTMSESECEENRFDYPAYIARGRYDEGKYVSIEYSDSFAGFTPGYYIVVVCSAPKADTVLIQALGQAKNFYKQDAYTKYADVYMGCIH